MEFNSTVSVLAHHDLKELLDFALLRGLRDEAWPVRAQAAWALGQAGVQAGVDVGVHALAPGGERARQALPVGVEIGECADAQPRLLRVDDELDRGLAVAGRVCLLDEGPARGWHPSRSR